MSETVLSPNQKYCESCRKIIDFEDKVCTCGKVQSTGTDKKLVAGLLGIFLGSFGVHKFYLGKTGIGVVYLLFFWTGIPLIIGLVEGIVYLTNDYTTFYQTNIFKA